MGEFAPLIIVTIFTILVTPHRYKRAANPAFLFCISWLCIVFLSNLRLFNLYAYSNDITRIIIIGVISFVAGHFLAIALHRVIFTIGKRKQYKRKQYKYELNYTAVYAMGMICLVYFASSFVRSFGLLISGHTLEYIRTMVQGTENGSSLNNLVSNFIVLPCASAIEALAISDFWLGNRDKRLFLMNICIIIFRTVSDAGRTPLFNFAIYMTVAFLLSASRKTLKKYNFSSNIKKHIRKNIKKYLFLVIVGILLLVTMTFSRTSHGVDRQIYFYFSMSPVLFDYWKKQVDAAQVWAFGTASFNGYVFTIAYFLKNVFHLGYAPFIQNIYDLIAATDSHWQNIAPGLTKANAYVSAFWFMYLDGRMFGVLIGMFIYGFFVTRCFISVLDRMNVKNLSIYLLLYSGLFFSFIRFPFAKPYYALSLIIIATFAYKKHIGNESYIWRNNVTHKKNN